MNEIHYFMVGMPSGGKTSYIIRLCSQLLMNECDMMYKLSDGELPDGYSYIKEQMDKMQSFQKIMRTFENIYYDMTLPLVNEKGDKISLVIPDLSGEHYRKLVEDRFISKKICIGLQQADEILFFINIETMEKEDRLKYNETNAAWLIEKSMHIKEQEKNDTSLDQVTDAEKATQSQVVELLQALLYLVKKKVKVKFVISAWDRVEKRNHEGGMIPENYLKDKLPLLYQYIISNTDKMNYEVFGVSAQGAEYDDNDEMEELEAADVDIATLVKLVMPDGEKYQDISRLLRKQE